MTCIVTNMNNSDNMLALLESYMSPGCDEVSRQIADDFRKRRLEKGLTREMVARQSRVALAKYLAL